MPPAIPTTRRPSRPTALGARLEMDGFVPDDLLASLLASGLVTRAGSLLVTESGRRYVLQEAVRILGLSGGGTDPFGYCGVVASLGSLLKRGFVLGAGRTAFGRLVYDVEHGVIVHAIGSADASGVNPAAGC